LRDSRCDLSPRFGAAPYALAMAIQIRTSPAEPETGDEPAGVRPASSGEPQADVLLFVIVAPSKARVAQAS
jgi:hypothetical protein